VGLSFLMKTGVDYFLSLPIDELNDMAEEAVKLYGKK
jgi:hypothetical protein